MRVIATLGLLLAACGGLAGRGQAPSVSSPISVAGPVVTATPAAALPSPAATARPCAVALAHLTRADEAMRLIAFAPTIDAAHAAAADLTAALSAVLPADGAALPAGPLALMVREGGDVTRELDDVAFGGLATWTTPSERYDEWRAVLLGWRPDRNTMPQLGSHLLRALGWATLVSRSNDLAAAHSLASVHGLVHTGLVLDAAQTAARRLGVACP
ncbi:MAG: hypothetical protein ABI888_02415 [Chloroflexota bacterium]